MKTEHSLEDAQELAALYALGSLPAEESTGFEQHLSSGCDVCTRELASLASVTEELGAAAPYEAPGERVRAAVLERFAAPVFEISPGIRFVRSERLDWQQPAGGSTVSVKLLSRDAQRGYRTQVIRMAPNSAFQPHRHLEVEELFLLEGEVTISGVVMRPGDYCRAEAGTVHDGIFTKTGCVFLALSSEHNERLSQ